MTPHLADTPVLETARLILRAPIAADFEATAPFIMSDRASFVGGGADCDLGRAWRIFAILTGHWALKGFGIFVIEEKATGRPIGSVGPFFPADWPERELGWTIWPESHEGKGLAYEAMVAIQGHVYRDLGWSSAVSYIDPKNARSIALAKRLGCRLDEDAKTPPPHDTQVWRHPAPAEVLA